MIEGPQQRKERAREAIRKLFDQFELEYPMFCRAWGLIGVTEATKHNLVVLATHQDQNQRLIAAHEVACAIIAQAVALGGQP